MADPRRSSPVDAPLRDAVRLLGRAAAEQALRETEEER